MYLHVTAPLLNPKNNPCKTARKWRVGCTSLIGQEKPSLRPIRGGKYKTFFRTCLICLLFYPPYRLAVRISPPDFSPEMFVLSPFSVLGSPRLINRQKQAIRSQSSQHLLLLRAVLFTRPDHFKLDTKWKPVLSNRTFFSVFC